CPRPCNLLSGENNTQSISWGTTSMRSLPRPWAGLTALFLFAYALPASADVVKIGMTSALSRGGTPPSRWAMTSESPHPCDDSVTSRRHSNSLFACRGLRAPATMNDEGLADAAAANPFRLPRLHPGIGSARPRSAAGHLLESLAFFRELHPVSVEVAGAVDVGRLLIDVGAVRQIADAGSRRMELSEVVLECDCGAVTRIRVGHPAARICRHERLDLLKGVGIEEQTLVRLVGKIGRPLVARTVVLPGRQRAEVRRDVLIRDAEL